MVVRNANPAASNCRIIPVMHCRFMLLSFLPLSVLLVPQTPDPNSAHLKEWTERHAHYLAQPRIKETDSSLEITSNEPRPLDSISDALAQQHGWHINCEDPQYREADIVDDTAPAWLRQSRPVSTAHATESRLV